jgi:hypothetical protein
VYIVDIGGYQKDFFVGAKTVKGPSLDKTLTKSAAFPAATNVARFLVHCTFFTIFKRIHYRSSNNFYFLS